MHSRCSNPNTNQYSYYGGREIRILDYIEGVGQEIGYYIAELRKRKYNQALIGVAA
jgi:hypothetical protein